MAQLKLDLADRGINIPKQVKKAQLIKLWKESATKVTRRSRQSALRQPDNALPEDQDVDDPEVGSQTTHNSPYPVNNNGDLHEAIASLTAIVNSLAEKVTSMEERNRRQNVQEGGVLSTTTVQNSTSPDSTDSPPEASNTSFPIPGPNVNDELTNLRGTVHAVRPDFGTDRPNREYTIGGSMDNFCRQSCTISKSTYGYVAESLPFVETISPQMRKNIIEGKDVNLCALLIPYYSGPMTNDERIDTYYCSNRKPDPRLNKTLSLSEFIQAFGTYKSVMSEAYSERRIELDLYERDIVDMANRYPGTGFYEYHKQFSATAAAYLKNHNIKVVCALLCGCNAPEMVYYKVISCWRPFPFHQGRLWETIGSLF